MKSRRWLRFARVLLVAYLTVMLVLLLFENRLIFPTWQIPEGQWNPAGVTFEPVAFQSDDGVSLFGWYLDHPHPRAYIVFCHGNGETVAHVGPEMAEVRDDLEVAIFVFDYRGYGRSKGKPDEQGVLRDGHAARAWLARRSGLKVNQLVYWGRSLGGAVVVDLACESGARGMILERTFTTMPDVAAAHFPWLPVRWMRTQFDSLSRIGRYDGPLLQTHGTRDEIVPIGLGRRLFEAARTRSKRFVELPGLGHNDPNPPSFRQVLVEFFATLPASNNQPR